jgi:hypothetical protein
MLSDFHSFGFLVQECNWMRWWFTNVGDKLRATMMRERDHLQDCIIESNLSLQRSPCTDPTIPAIIKDAYIKSADEFRIRYSETIEDYSEVKALLGYVFGEICDDSPLVGFNLVSVMFGGLAVGCAFLTSKETVDQAQKAAKKLVHWCKLFPLFRGPPTFSSNQDEATETEERISKGLKRAQSSINIPQFTTKRLRVRMPSTPGGASKF